MAIARTVIDISVDGARRANSTTVYRPPASEPANKEQLNANIRNMKDSHFKIRK